MYFQLFCITILVTVINLTECKEAGVSLRTQWAANPPPRDNKVQLADSIQCPVWFFYDSTTNQCECYSIHPRVVKCIKQKVFLKYGFYMTYSSERGFIISSTIYYDASGLIHKPTTEPDFIELPSNISEINDYMCGPANRKGILCSECIDGFGPSATSPKFKCSNCTSVIAKYSAVIYLLSELVPVTVFYFIVLFFQLNLTSAPMVSFIFYSQVVHNVINYAGVDPADQMKSFLSIASVFHGVWNLDFFRYVIPPFCISPNLQIIHIVYLQSISAIFPFILIGITWICIALYSRNCIVLVWLWRAFNRLFLKNFKLMQNPSRTVIDTFATFFLLLYTKLMFVLAIVPSLLMNEINVNATTLMSNVVHRPALDPSKSFFHKSHLIPNMAISVLIFVIAILPPVLLLALYPIRVFRSLLFKCCSSRCMASLTIFVERFYSCYKDGLDGGRDMRSWASLPFFLIILGFAMWSNESSRYLVSILCMCWSLAVVIFQPYKDRFMAITDAFMLANVSILSTVLDLYNNRLSSHFHRIDLSLKVFGMLPMLWLVGFVTFKVFKTKIKAMLKMAREKLPCCNYLLNYGHQNEEDDRVQQIGDPNYLPCADRMLRPEQYMRRGYDSIS